jgi:hypothetical protein
MPKSFAVKHSAAKRKALVQRIATYSVTPWSFSSKDRETSDAASGGTIYVIEVRRARTTGTKYWLGYRFQSVARVTPFGGGRWENEFMYKNVASPAPAIGQFFPEPILIRDTSFNEWYRRTQGMVELPSHQQATLDRMFADRSLRAITCV